MGAVAVHCVNSSVSLQEASLDPAPDTTMTPVVSEMLLIVLSVELIRFLIRQLLACHRGGATAAGMAPSIATRSPLQLIRSGHEGASFVVFEAHRRTTGLRAASAIIIVPGYVGIVQELHKALCFSKQRWVIAIKKKIQLPNALAVIYILSNLELSIEVIGFHDTNYNTDIYTYDRV